MANSIDKQQHRSLKSTYTDDQNKEIQYQNHRKLLEQSINILKIALPKMADLDIPPIPENYAVWYQYSQRSSAKLNEIIDQMLSQHNEFSPAINHQLYMDHVAPTHCSILEQTHDHTKRLVQTLRDKIDVMNSGTDHYSSELNQFQRVLQTDLDMDTLSSLVANLLVETENVNRSNELMKSSLAKMSDQVEHLKKSMISLSEVALTDALTGIANRRAFDDMLVQYLKQAQPFCLLMLDIDHFKIFNDTYGHSVGDKVLIYVSEMLRSSIKGQDFVARFGGEEFVILLPNTDRSGGVAVAESIRANIASKKLATNQGKTAMGYVTISIGVAKRLPSDGAISIIERADKALYKAKNSGRDCVVSDKTL